ncbi:MULTISPECIES: hypothetical protein [Kitasatospora]|uniref:FAS1 domain-containing protein n=1 Tax=Kitasatospora cystarginea TaxID=58350 RepID=A0ABN3EUI2_9ACTN
MTNCSNVDARAALAFLKNSGLINMNTTLEQLVSATTTLGEIAGYVLAWDKYVLVVPSVAEDVSQA